MGIAWRVGASGVGGMSWVFEKEVGVSFEGRGRGRAERFGERIGCTVIQWYCCSSLSSMELRCFAF